MVKNILRSKVFWLNFLTILVLILDSKDVVQILPHWVQERSTGILALLNIFLRLQTRTGVTVRKTEIKETVDVPTEE